MLIILLFTAQNTIHLEFNFSLLIFDKINCGRDCCIVCHSIYDFWQPLLFLQIVLANYEKIVIFASGFVNYKKGCTRLAVASDKVYQLLAHGRSFSPGTPASSTTKTGRHDIAEILLKVTLNTKNQIKSKTVLICYIIIYTVYCSNQ